MKRRSFLLSLLAPALTFLGIGRDRIRARSMVIEGEGGKLVFPNVVITSRSPFQDLADINDVQSWSAFPVYRSTGTPTYYDPRRVAPRTTEGDPFS